MSIRINKFLGQFGFTSRREADKLILEGRVTVNNKTIQPGYKVDENDDWWFLIKDSGSGSRNGRFPGYYFYHEDYVKLKMMTFTIHKDAVKEILDRIQND